MTSKEEKKGCWTAPLDQIGSIGRISRRLVGGIGVVGGLCFIARLSLGGLLPGAVARSGSRGRSGPPFRSPAGTLRPPSSPGLRRRAARN